MYGVKYKVPYKTISGKDSVVTLEERGYTGHIIELVAGGDPFIVDIDRSDLLTPIRSSTATLSVLGSDYLQDLYANDPQGIRITHTVNGDTAWIGYLLPDTFSQDFSSPEFVFEVEAVAAISALKYKEFDLTDDFVTFRQIIEKAVEYSGYKATYLTNAVRAKTGKFYDLKISSSNFFDELGEAMFYYEVLEEMAKYLGCCFTPFGEDLYLLDFAAIRRGFNSYTKLEGATVTDVTLSDAKMVDNYRGTGAKISRIAGKNKAKVRSSLYEIKNILPSYDGEGTTYLTMEDFEETLSEGKDNVTYKGIMRYFQQPRFSFYKYIAGDRNSPYIMDGRTPDDDTGACFVKTAEYRMDDIPSRINMVDELQVKLNRNFDEAVGGKHLWQEDKILSIISNEKILIHGDVWFCINLQVKEGSEKWSKSESQWRIKRDHVSKQRAEFRVGDYYYNGAGWSTTPASFYMDISMKEGDALYGEYRNIDNTNTFDKGIGDLQGYTFKAPDFPLMGECELTLYAYYSEAAWPTFDLYTKYLYYKNIKVSYGIPNMQSIYGDWVDEDSTNDALYENEIDEGYIDEAETIDLKICTNTDSKLALSSVIEGEEFLKTLYSDVYGVDQPEYLLLDRVIDMFGKPRFVIDPTLEATAKPYTLFTEPHLNKQFLLAGGEIDAKRESATYNLIEL